MSHRAGPDDEPPDAASLIAARDHLRADALDGLTMENVPLAAIARTHGTPTWVYGAATIRNRARRLAAAMPGVAIHYAVKANDHLAILGLLGDEGVGADIVSGGELLRARRAGIPPGRIVFSGVGKTHAELALALEHGIGQINVESPEELRTLSAVAVARGATARVALRINPDIDAGTHDKIATGRAGDKFGIPWADAAALYRLAARLPGIVPVGLAVHIGSQIGRVAPFAAAYARLADLVRCLRADGLAVETADCGGGLGFSYDGGPACLPEAWAACIRRHLGPLDLRLAIEPGRWLIAPAGILLTAVIRTRHEGQHRPIVILDAAMNDLLRPALYDAWHGIIPVGATRLAAPAEPTDIAGPVCESSDFFARDRRLPRLEEHDLVAILDAGAYGAVMSSAYNARPRAAQVLIDGPSGRLPGFTLIRPRSVPDDLWAGEIVPLQTAS
jgi:diaminopimelate decarboxylase